MSTYLQLCQALRRESGVAGSGPTTTVAQTGIYEKLCIWVQRAWVDIQNEKKHWKFHRTTLNENLVIGTRTYDLLVDWVTNTVDTFDPEGGFIYDVSDADQTQLTWMNYGDFRRKFNHGFGTGRPSFVTQAPGNDIAFDMIPDKTYTIKLDYWLTPEKFAADADIPSCPEQHHDVILWKALQLYAGSEDVPELWKYAMTQYTPRFIKLCLDQTEAPSQVKSYPFAFGGSSIASSTGFSS